MFHLPKVYLASKSPRRRELLKQIGVPFEMLLLREQSGRDADVDETPAYGEAPRAYVERVSRLKAQVGWLRVQQRAIARQPVLAADTTVARGVEIFGKPLNAADAAYMLRRLAGGEHTVFTCVSVMHNGRLSQATTETVVRFAPLGDAEVDAYVRSGEPLDKAGGYAIQGLAQGFVEEIRGSYSGVVGLPLEQTVRLLRSL